MKETKAKERIIAPDDAVVIKAISERIKQLRIATGLSYEAFAAKNDLHRITYYKLESGKQNFTIATLVKVLRGLGISFQEFSATLLDKSK
ncbi:MAG: helix-turn-helix transcriptional regulator [Bacteroidetes bacterium]|nr:helix-turn-helix transcriptional regulator [Bacteroidota bacterium]